jgi:TOMM system kinase/cyclase fusion protein
MEAVNGVFEDAYEILGTLGQGGFGVVYKARQRTTGQLVAIKTMLPRGSAPRSDKLLARFLRETQLCAQLYHPNIVQLINAGETREHQLYTVFAYAPGKTLSQVLAEEGALDPEEARHLLLEVLDALACAHGLGIVHRDLKPSNIMVVTTGARRNALVLDFGISTVVKDMGPSDQERLTGTAELLGTPGYAAPEQLNRLESSPATDIFSWGLVFLECLTGRPVYTAATLHDMLYKQLGPEPIPVPSAIRLHPLGKLLEAVTRKDPATRPSSATRVLKQLEAISLRGLSRSSLAESGPLAISQNVVSTMTIVGRDHSQITDRTMTTEEALSSERRQVTALCCAVRVRPAEPREAPSPLGPASGPISSKRILDVEEQNRALVDLFGLCVRVVQQHHGCLVATFGEQALFFFGFPHADEQDGKRAARAALALRAALSAERARYEKHGTDISSRIGIHSGLIVAPSSTESLDASLTVGQTPRIAAQIAAAAPPSGILVSGVAQRILRSSFEFEAQGVLSDGGEPVKLFRLQGEHVTALGTVRNGQTDTPLVGREPEIKLLLTRWEQARDGTGQCSLVTGEPGIGKSRLADELRRRLADEPHTLLTVRCAPDAQNSPLYPVVDLLERLLEREGDSAGSDRLSRLASLLSRHGLDVAANLPLLAALLAIPLGGAHRALDISPELQKSRTLAALCALLFAIAEARPAVLLVEDLHWADSTTLDFLSQLVVRVSSAPLCVVLTARPELPQTALPTTGVLQISLSRLRSEDTEALVAELFEGRDVPEEVLEQIIKRTDGVPLFVEEFAQMLIESGVLVLRGDGYELSRPLTDADIPASLRDLLTSRLDRTGKPARETAQLAAAIGREFGFALLSATSDRPPEEVEADLKKLQAAGLIQSKRKVGDRGYVFKHALIRDAAHESLSLSARRQIHARLARTLEERFPQIVESRPDLLAQHHAAAEQRREAIGYAKKAAKAGLTRSAWVEAAGQVNQALAWASSLADAKERATAELELDSLLMPALMAMGGAGDSRLEALTARILTLADSLGASPYRFPTLYALTTYHHIHSNRAKALELAARLVALAREAGDVSAELAGLAIQAQCFIMAGRHEDARASAERSISLYDPDKHRQMVLTYGVDLKTFAHSMLAEALAFLGHLDRAVAEAENAIAWGRELGLPNMIARSLFFSAFVHRVREDRPRTVEVTREAIAIADRYGLPFSKAWAGMFSAWATDDAAELARILDNNKRRGEPVCRPFLLEMLAECEAAQGQLPAALAHVEEALRFADEQQDLMFLSGVLRQKGTLILVQDPGALDVAEDCFRRAIDVAQGQRAKTEEVAAALELARVLSKRGKPREAHERLSAVTGWFQEGFDTRPVREARALLADLARRE